jgi:hypothetical protein
MVDDVRGPIVKDAAHDGPDQSALLDGVAGTEAAEVDNRDSGAATKISQAAIAAC